MSREASHVLPRWMSITCKCISYMHAPAARCRWGCGARRCRLAPHSGTQTRSVQCSLTTRVLLPPCRGQHDRPDLLRQHERPALVDPDADPDAVELQPQPGCLPAPLSLVHPGWLGQRREPHLQPQWQLALPGQCLGSGRPQRPGRLRLDHWEHHDRRPGRFRPGWHRCGGRCGYDGRQQPRRRCYGHLGPQLGRPLPKGGRARCVCVCVCVWGSLSIP